MELGLYRPNDPTVNRRKTGRPRIEDRAKTNEARKPWLRLGMSRRTCYRRQAEKREAMKAKRARLRLKEVA